MTKTMIQGEVKREVGDDRYRTQEAGCLDGHIGAWVDL